MTGTLARLLRGVLENPASDRHRLVYADALDEAGQGERAEFIRVQCELAKADGCECLAKFPCRYCQLRRREDELARSRHMDDWLPVREYIWFAEHDRGGWCVCVGSTDRAKPFQYSAVFRRGFVEEVSDMPAADWLRHGNAIVASHPVRAVTLTTWPDLCVQPRGETVFTAAPPVPIEPPPRLVRLHGPSSARATKELFAAWWPGVTFRLPEEASLDVEAYAAEMRDALIRSLGIPSHVMGSPQPPTA